MCLIPFALKSIRNALVENESAVVRYGLMSSNARLHFRFAFDSNLLIFTSHTCTSISAFRTLIAFLHQTTSDILHIE
jgi:hypothetical protein